jgi:hypothetical protein
MLTVMVSTVASVLLFLTNSFSVELAGFFFVPALVGVSLAVTSGAVLWATATAETAIESTAASATIRYLRKETPPQECEGTKGTGQASPGWAEPIRMCSIPAGGRKLRC